MSLYLPILPRLASWADDSTHFAGFGAPLAAGPLAAGDRAGFRQPKLRPAVWQGTGLDKGTRSLTWVIHSPVVQVTGLHRAEEIGRSRVTLSNQFSGLPGPLITCIHRRLNQRYIATEAEGFRKWCES